MSIQSDHKALLFLGAIATLGASVRVGRAITSQPPGNQAALAHQMQAADSAKRALTARRPEKKGRAAKASAAGAQTPTQTPAATSGSAHRDYKGRLDLDVATAAEIDLLAGVSPALAKRIVADRNANGAFRELTALRRVKGVSPKLLAQLDSVASFSGAYHPPQPTDTILPTKGRRKR